MDVLNTTDKCLPRIFEVFFICVHDHGGGEETRELIRRSKIALEHFSDFLHSVIFDLYDHFVQKLFPAAFTLSKYLNF